MDHPTKVYVYCAVALLDGFDGAPSSGVPLTHVTVLYVVAPSYDLYVRYVRATRLYAAYTVLSAITSSRYPLSSALASCVVFQPTNV